MIEKANLLPQTLATGKYVIISEVFKLLSLSLNWRLVLFILHIQGTPGSSSHANIWVTFKWSSVKQIQAHEVKLHDEWHRYVRTKTAGCTKSQQKQHPASKILAIGLCAHWLKFITALPLESYLCCLLWKTWLRGVVRETLKPLKWVIASIPAGSI